MLLSLDVVRQIATEVARERSDEIEVVAALTHAGGSGHTEILILRRGCVTDDCLSFLSLDRQTSERDLRATLTRKLRAHLRE